ncbi:8059_t:CDS:2, partial [Paraglomus occultum]
VKEELRKKAAIQATAGGNQSHKYFCVFLVITRNSLLIWARKQRGPYYDPSTRMYHVDKNSKHYYEGYTEANAEAENEAAGFKNVPLPPTKPVFVNVEKELVSIGNHLSPARSGSPSGRRPGRPRKSESRLNG